MKKYIFTCGDINGIGPEVVLKTINRLTKNRNEKLLLIFPKNVFLEHYKICNSIFDFEIVSDPKYISENKKIVSVVSLGNAKTKIKVATKESGEVAYNAIKYAYDLSIENKNNAIITAPISKTALKLAGINFAGHTEIFANFCNVKNFAMMFVSEKMKASIATIHIPIKDVDKKITIENLKSRIDVLLNSLRNDFGIANPKIALLGLNPHAGENGNIGVKEIEVINKIINNKNIFGAFPADGFFAAKKFLDYDLIFGMYHDQVLIPFKMLFSKTGVNFTAGLPIIRTSPDHGTAYDIAGKNIADESSTLAAFKVARKIAASRSI
ncbi:MAG: 4-hydroxythreonine-4-phosphate dehydrogenase PdxA [Chlorobiaceae bacterium]|nr:4-hydroxythreonine-4-phosphate dehydrogenase PdxA [Chlorobiaceae bacterium]MBA4310976.1 4-hydroxythreonine-4-phosphate dehydrogenase PdxA [Chlorobiaceae bacterium]